MYKCKFRLTLDRHCFHRNLNHGLMGECSDILAQRPHSGQPSSSPSLLLPVVHRRGQPEPSKLSGSLC